MSDANLLNRIAKILLDAGYDGRGFADSKHERSANDDALNDLIDLFERHDGQYPSRQKWRAGMFDAIMSWRRHHAAKVQEPKPCPNCDGMEIISRLQDAEGNPVQCPVCCPPEPKPVERVWPCQHIERCERHRDGSVYWKMDVRKGLVTQATHFVDDSWTLCPICGARRPDEKPPTEEISSTSAMCNNFMETVGANPPAPTDAEVEALADKVRMIWDKDESVWNRIARYILANYDSKPIPGGKERDR